MEEVFSIFEKVFSRFEKLTIQINLIWNLIINKEGKWIKLNFYYEST